MTGIIAALFIALLATKALHRPAGGRSHLVAPASVPAISHLSPTDLPPGLRRTPCHSRVAAIVVAAARAQVGTLYNSDYVTIPYPGGDVPAGVGACTDVVIRALRKAGFDLQKLIHEDMARNYSRYPHVGDSTGPDPNIDHRRVAIQMRFFARKGRNLTTKVSSETLSQWQPGDVVDWVLRPGQLHTGIVSDVVNADGIPLVIHNMSVCTEAECLTAWPIIGHFRYPSDLAPGHR